MPKYLKKYLILFLAVFSILPIFTGCKEKSWDDETPSGEIETAPIELEDLNLTGELYTEANKPKDSIPFVVYAADPELLKSKKFDSFVLKENLNLDYILEVVNVFSFKSSATELTGKIEGNKAIVTVNYNSDFSGWLSNVYSRELFEKYKYDNIDYSIYITEKTPDSYSNGLSMLAMEIINNSIIENLKDIDAVEFRTKDNKPIKLLGISISDGVFFYKTYPYYIGSKYNYYENIPYEELEAKTIKIYPNTVNFDNMGKLLQVNAYVNNLTMNKKYEDHPELKPEIKEPVVPAPEEPVPEEPINPEDTIVKTS